MGLLYFCQGREEDRRENPNRSLLGAAIGLRNGKRFLASLLGPPLHPSVALDQKRHRIDMLDRAMRVENGIARVKSI